MAEPIIAIIFDCDGTLCPDTISFMLEKYNIDPKNFWEKEIKALVQKGWDPPQAYMDQILKYVKRGQIPDLTREKLRALGQEVSLFPGLPNMFVELKEYVSEKPDLKNAHVQLEYYIISGGLEEMILGTGLAKHMNGVFGCNFEHDPGTHLPIAIKSTISFTEKTRYVFAINKGISPEETRTNPYLVNDSMLDQQRRISPKNIIYVGDGPSDIPCLSLIKKRGGEGIGVTHTGFKKNYEMARGERITIGPYSANYEKDTDMRGVLEQIILKKGIDIAVEKKKSVVSAPTY